MRKYGLYIAIALLVLVNIIVLASVILNRSGEPDAVVELTERELPLDVYQEKRENTGISLRLIWNQYPFYGRFLLGKSGESQYDWFDKAKLEEAGFDCSVPLADTNAAIHYEKLLPRKAYVVLEYDGKTWDELVKQERLSLSAVAERHKNGTATDKDLKEAKEEYERMLKTRSRLFAVDVGKDPVKLRLQYPDRSHFIIMAAKVRLQFAKPYGSDNKGLPKLEGYINEILISEVHVPIPMSTELEDIITKAGHRVTTVYSSSDTHKDEPSYKIRLYYGKLFEPRVVGIRPSAP